MTCEQVRRSWLEERDRGAPPSASVEVHCHTCAACRRYVVEMNLLLAGLAELKEATAQIEERDAMRPLSRERSPIGPVWIRSAMGIAAAIALLVGAGYWMRLPPPRVEVAFTAPASPVPAVVRLRGDSATRYFSVRQEGAEAGVEVIWLYPSRSAEKSNRI